jgi:hypothetical protein
LGQVGTPHPHIPSSVSQSVKIRTISETIKIFKFLRKICSEHNHSMWFPSRRLMRLYALYGLKIINLYVTLCLYIQVRSLLKSPKGFITCCSLFLLEPSYVNKMFILSVEIFVVCFSLSLFVPSYE